MNPTKLLSRASLWAWGSPGATSPRVGKSSWRRKSPNDPNEPSYMQQRDRKKRNCQTLGFEPHGLPVRNQELLGTPHSTNGKLVEHCTPVLPSFPLPMLPSQTTNVNLWGHWKTSSSAISKHQGLSITFADVCGIHTTSFSIPPRSTYRTQQLFQHRLS